LHPPGAWELPGGNVSVDAVLTRAIAAAHPAIDLDAASHAREHCLEVQVPFLRWRNPAVRIAAMVSRCDDADELRDVGEALAAAIGSLGEPVLVVASTDMSHYIAADDAARLDGLALRAVEAMDPAQLVATCRRHDISMCGYRTTAAAITAIRALGGGSAEPTGYTNSSEGGGERESVVGYAGMLFV
jgi:AmmeMemoRadiSam system protein B